VKDRFSAGAFQARFFSLEVLCLLMAAVTGFGAASVHAAAVVIERLDHDVASGVVSRLVGGAYDAEFTVQPYAAITPSPDHAVWYRVRALSDWATPKPPLLSIADPQGLEIQAYAPPGYTGESHSIYDASVQTGFSRHALTIALPEGLRASDSIYLRVAPERPNPRRLELEDVTRARVADLARARMDVLFPALQLATVLVMLAFFLALRERMYGYFVAHVVLLVIWEMYTFGIGYEIPPFDLLAPLGARPTWLFCTTATIMMFLFSSEFLDLKQCAPRIDRALRALCWPLGLLAFCAAIAPLSPGWWVEDVKSWILVVSSPLLIVAGVLSWHAGSRRGGFYLCAMVPGLLFMTARTLQLIMHWPLAPWLEFAMPAGFALSSVVLSFGLADHILSMRHERDVAHRLAEHDALTGVLNRRAIVARLRGAFGYARANDAPLSLLFLDLDHFKHVNDSYGHRAGDQCLRAVVDPIASELRQDDALGRYGGEEFLVVLPDVTARDAQAVAERIRTSVQDLPMLISGKRIDLTLSVGIASLAVGMHTPEDLIERADVALYRAKAGGRNRVRYAEGSMTPRPMPMPGFDS
jgi:diguanylate cyclase (GGDEF)-like protein